MARFEIPATYEEFQQAVDPEKMNHGLSYEVATAFGALDHCTGCGNPIIRSDAFGIAVAMRYGLADQGAEEWELAADASGLEVGDYEHPGVCGQCGEQIRQNR